MKSVSEQIKELFCKFIPNEREFYCVQVSGSLKKGGKFQQGLVMSELSRINFICEMCNIEMVKIVPCKDVYPGFKNDYVDITSLLIYENHPRDMKSGDKN